MTSQCAEPSKVAGMRYHGNVMTTTRWRLCVTMEMLSQHVDDVSSVMHAGCLHADRTIQIHQYEGSTCHDYVVL